MYINTLPSWTAWDVLLHTGNGETTPCALFLSLSPQSALLAQRQSARLEQFGQTLARRRRAVEPELERFTSRTRRRSPVAPIERVRLGGLGREVVEHDDAALGGAGDLAQGVLDGFPLQVHHHALPEEEGWLRGVETRIHEPRQPVLLLEVGGHERDRGRVDASLRERLAL